MFGTITFYNNQKGFGFITVPSGQQYFFHISNCGKGESPVLEGRVQFEVGPPVAVGKKAQALRVRYIRDTDAKEAGLEIALRSAGGAQ
jgi:cold shock CspA family protein